ncbi:MAG TPA: hypothetical protein VMU42_00340 [Candidatus Sulfotelmatobacter sp.]|nr:hypothetical protein [Candidatus Sulfotelmatobacter sp.]
MAASCRIALAACLTSFFAFALTCAIGPAGAAEKAAPACGAISFRPLASGMSDGEQDAGLYKSRFVKIEIKATVKSGEPQEYHMVLNGKTPTPLSGPLPKSVDGCLRSKHVVVPVKQMQGACIGTRFRVVTHHEGKDRLAMFFGLRGSEWHLCSAAAF